MKRILDYEGEASVSKEWNTAWLDDGRHKTTPWLGTAIEGLLLRAWKRPLLKDWHGRLHILVELVEEGE